MRRWATVSYSSRMVLKSILAESSRRCHCTVIASYLTFESASALAVIARAGSVTLATSMIAIDSCIWNR